MSAGSMSAGPVDAILLVEDEPLVALLVENTLLAAGYAILGPVATVTAGLKLLQSVRPLAAVLDITLRDGLVFPLADALVAKRVPLLFLSGNSEHLLPAAHRQRGLLAKPFRRDTLLQAVRGLLASAEPAP